MSLNCTEIDIVLSELDAQGAFIQDIVQPGYDSIALYLYKTSYNRAKCLYICLAPNECRLHETARTIPKNKTPLRFMEFLKSRIKGARIESIGQIGCERIVRIQAVQGDVSYNLFIRLWSGAANIVVTDDSLHILDVFYRRPKRGEISGGTFILPDTSQAHSQTEQSAPHKEFQKRDFTQGEYAECFRRSGVDPKALSFNEQLDKWYAEYGKTSSRTLLLAQAYKAYEQRVGRIQSAVLRLEEKRRTFLHADLYKRQGDLILANAHLLKEQSALAQQHTEERAYKESVPIECFDYESGKPVSIRIDPKKSAAENAADFYAQYKKARSGLADLEKDILDLKQELEDVQASYEEIKAEENPLRIRQFLQKKEQTQKPHEKKRPGVGFTIGEWQLFAGRSAAENDELLRRHVNGLDLWLHTRDWSGGYVFIKNRRGKTVPLDILIDAGNLAVFYSKARKAKTADVYYTQVKYLRRAKGAPKGTVLPTHEKNITITLDDERIRKMEKMKTHD